MDTTIYTQRLVKGVRAQNQSSFEEGNDWLCSELGSGWGQNAFPEELTCELGRGFPGKGRSTCKVVEPGNRTVTEETAFGWGRKSETGMW